MRTANHAQPETRGSWPAPARSAFTLIELMVAITILVAIMAMVGMVFQTAGRSSGQAQASSTVYRQLLSATQTICRDVEAMKGSTGKVMGIATVKVQARIRETDALAEHRADVLMLLTQRPFSPFVFDQPVGFAEMTQVVYGHADLGVQNAAGTWTSVNHVEATPESEILASQWHLARRTIGFPTAAITTAAAGTAPWPLTHPDFLQGKADVLRGEAASTTLSRVFTGLFKFGSTSPLPSYFFNDGVNTYLVDNTGSYLYEAAQDHWFRAATPPNWTRSDNGVTIPTSAPPPPSLADPPTGTGLTNFAKRWFYDSTSSDRRTLLDVSPATGQTDRLAAYFLPGCSEFKVEFTYDDPREIAVESDAQRSVLVTTDTDWDADGNLDTHVLAPKPINWQSVPDGEQWVWSGLSVNPNNPTDPFRWPRAIRITIRAYGKGGALQEPITESIIKVFD